MMERRAAGGVVTDVVERGTGGRRPALADAKEERSAILSLGPNRRAERRGEGRSLKEERRGGGA